MPGEPPAAPAAPGPNWRPPARAARRPRVRAEAARVRSGAVAAVLRAPPGPTAGSPTARHPGVTRTLRTPRRSLGRSRPWWRTSTPTPTTSDPPLPPHRYTILTRGALVLAAGSLGCGLGYRRPRGGGTGRPSTEDSVSTMVVEPQFDHQSWPYVHDRCGAMITVCTSVRWATGHAPAPAHGDLDTPGTASLAVGRHRGDRPLWSCPRSWAYRGGW